MRKNLEPNGSSLPVSPEYRRDIAAITPSPVLVLGAIVSVQVGSALASHLFATIGSGGAAFLRLAFGSLILLAVWRPGFRRYQAADYRVAILFGLVTAAMNFSFYSSLDRVPLGVAVTLEFVGPLGLAVAGARHRLDMLWAALASLGVVLLAPWGGLRLDPVGIGLGLLAGVFWAGYILLSARVGSAFAGGAGLAIAMVTGATALLPVGVLGAGRALLTGQVLGLGAGVGILSAVIPYSFEMEALRRLPTRAFGVLMSTEPAVGTIVGLVLLRQVLSWRALAAVLLVSVAALGTARGD